MISDELASVIEEIDNLDWDIGVWWRYITDIDLSERDREVEMAIKMELAQNFEEAMANIDEYASNEPMQERMMMNIYQNRHVIVTEGVVEQVFDTAAAGDYNDVRAGQEAAWALSPNSPSDDPYWRSFWWRVIYTGTLPEKLKWKSFDPGLYDAIINARLDAWGSKAPFWMFIEYGTVPGGEGGGTPYPTFMGGSPVARTAAKANNVAHKILRSYILAVEKAIADDLEKEFVGIGEPEEKVLRAWTVWFEYNGQTIRREYDLRSGRFIAGRTQVK